MHYKTSRLVINTKKFNSEYDEPFNSIINKDIADKKIDFSVRRSDNSRVKAQNSVVEAAFIAFNSKQLIRKIHNKMSNVHSPHKY